MLNYILFITVIVFPLLIIGGLFAVIFRKFKHGPEIVSGIVLSLISIFGAGLIETYNVILVGSLFLGPLLGWVMYFVIRDWNKQY